MKQQLTFILFIILVVSISVLTMSGCANIIPPNGGPRDTLPPKLVIASPNDSATNVMPKAITLTFNEFVEVKDIANQLIVSPNPQNLPSVDYKLKNVTIKLKDTLQPNTTYSLNFGDAIRDINEGNIAKNVSYVFSTGNTIAKGMFSGKAIMAQTGAIDSSLIVVLHQNTNDTAVYKNKPQYYTKLNGKGEFYFHHIAPGTYGAFVLPNSYSKKYDDSTKPFAFLNHPILISDTTQPAQFYVYSAENMADKIAATNGPSPTQPKNNKSDTKLKYITSLENGMQDILDSQIQITFNKKIAKFDSTQILLCDTLNKPLSNVQVQLDSSRKSIFIINRNAWVAKANYRLLISKTAVLDSTLVGLAKNDTLTILTRPESDYGSIRLRFQNLIVEKNPVLLWVQNEKIVASIPLNRKEWYKKFFKPGDYDIRILFDINKNGKWDAGSYTKKLQPEIVVDLKTRISIKANWDNEKDIMLPTQ